MQMSLHMSEYSPFFDGEILIWCFGGIRSQTKPGDSAFKQTLPTCDSKNIHTHAKKRNKEKCKITCRSRSVAESGNSASVSWLSLQFSIRDQGDLAELEFRLSITTILYEQTNMLNYTARNIFAYQEAKVIFCSSGKHSAFRSAWFLVF